MPARDYTKAYALLEQSLGDRHPWRLVPSVHPSVHAESLDHAANAAAQEAPPLPSVRVQTLSDARGHGELNGTPPTPSSHRTLRTTTTVAPNHQLEFKPRVPGRFPSYQMSPPTPDATPPASLDRTLAPPSSSALTSVSTGAESFFTAREEQSLLDSDTGATRSASRASPLASHDQPPQSAMRYGSLKVAGLSKDMPSLEIMVPRSSTPLEQHQTHKGVIAESKQSSAGTSTLYDHIVPAQLYKERSRSPHSGSNSLSGSASHQLPFSRTEGEVSSMTSNSTSHQRQQHELVKTFTPPSFATSAPSTGLKQDGMRFVDTSESQQAENPSQSWKLWLDNQTSNGLREINGRERKRWIVSPTHDVLELLSSDGKQHHDQPASIPQHHDKTAQERLSSASGGSNVVVEAMVIVPDSPPQHFHRTLRHVSKSIALRSQCSDSDQSSSGHPERLVEDSSKVVTYKERIQVRLLLSSLCHLRPTHASLQVARNNNSVDLQTYRDSFGLNLSMYSGRTRGNPKDDHSLLKPGLMGAQSATHTSSPLTNGVTQRRRSWEDEHNGIAVDNAFSPIETEKLVPPARWDNGGRKSTDQSTVHTESIKRSSMDQVVAIPPFPPGLEIHRAGAITVYPHDDKSLLVVQHSSSITGSTVRATLTPMLTIGGKPIDLDLQHLRPLASTSTASSTTQLPLPPTVTIIPPTPASDTRTLASTHDRSQTTTPVRQPSFINRASRYSLDLIQRNLPSQSPKQHMEQSRFSVNHADSNGNLHPFWRPRGFWNDLSDSEDSDSDDSEREGAVFGRRKVYNSHSRDKRDSGAQSWRWSNGIWRKGGSLRGFLIGNTLGLERGPTNKRPHVVDVALIRSRNQSQGQGMMQGVRNRLQNKPAKMNAKFHRDWLRRTHV